MAQLAAPQQAQIDRDLEHAMREWSRLPEVEAVYNTWDEDLVLDFVFEWTLEEDRIRRLAAHAERNEFTPQQRERYRTLMDIVRHNRPIAERLIDA